MMDLQEEAVTGPKKVPYRATYSNISPSILRYTCILRNLGHIFPSTAVAHLRLERGDGGGAARGGGVAHDAGHRVLQA